MSKAKRWKPKIGEQIWWITSFGIVAYGFWTKDTLDKKFFSLGNCFQTKEEAEAVARKLKGFWKDVREQAVRDSPTASQEEQR